MPLDREPPDGDYAAYIDKLVNGEGASPGAVQKTLVRGARRRPGARQHAKAPDTLPVDTPRTVANDTQASATPSIIRRDHNSHTEFENVLPGVQPARPDSLGPRGSPRLAGIVQIVLGLGVLALFARVAIRMTYSHDPFSLDNIVPLMLLGFIARMFLVRGNARLREAGSRHARATSAKIRRQHRSPPS